ncbi:MAG: hypothetical protein KDE22_08030 [Rhodobacterales bacterium]|nr:hypothetical protein [Rhodobacterales bacterium]
MNDNGEGQGPSPADMEAMLAQLKASGLFDQLATLQGNLQAIGKDLESLGGLATSRLQETENLATHVLALECILSVLLRQVPVDAGPVLEAVRIRTAGASGDPQGSPAVRQVVTDLLGERGNA